MHKRWLRLLVSILVLSTLLLGACGGSKAQVNDLNMGFGGAVVQGQDGQVVVSIGKELTSVAAIEYSNAGQIKGEWIIDGKKTPVAFNLPEIVEDPDEKEAQEWSVAPVEYKLPTNSAGVHTVSFSLTSPKKLSTETIEYVNQTVLPPASNANEYTVSMRLGNGYCNVDNDHGLAGTNDEFALAITVANVKSQAETRVLLDGNAGKIYPPGGDIATDDDAPFTWDSYVGGPWTIDATDALNIKTYLYELDGGGFLKAVLSAASTVTGISGIGGNLGADDYLGHVARDISSEDLGNIANEPAYPQGRQKNGWGALTEKGERVYTLHFGPSPKGDVYLELIVKVVAK